MKKLITLLVLQVKSLFSQPLIVVIFFLFPLIMSSLTGIAALNNDRSLVLPGIVDLAENDDSEQFVHFLQKGNPNWQIFKSETQANLALKQNKIQVLVKIPASFKLPNKPQLIYASGSKREALSMVLEDLAGNLLNILFQSNLKNSLAAEVQRIGHDPELIRNEFNTKVEAKIQDGGVIELEIADGVKHDSVQSLLYVPEYNIELIFLSFFALITVLSGDNHGFELRLLRQSGAYYKQAFSQLVVLMSIAFLQIISFHLGLKLFSTKVDLDMGIVFILLTFFFVQLVLTNIFKLIKENHRLTAALLYNIFAATVGGCFFVVPTPLLRKAAYFSPHAYASGLIEGISLPPPIHVFCASLLLFSVVAVIGSKIEKKRLTR